MIRTFEFGIEQASDLYEYEVQMVLEINDSEHGLYMTIDGTKFYLTDQNIRDLKEILAQVELPE